jgi:hypothetical protein
VPHYKSYKCTRIAFNLVLEHHETPKIVNFVLQYQLSSSTVLGILTMSELIYLACPYNSPNPQIMEERARTANRIAAELMARGALVFSPLTHNLPLLREGLPAGWSHWAEFDQTVLERCDKLIVVKLEGWEDSAGVRNELKLARDRNMPIEFLDPAGYGTDNSLLCAERK